MSHLRIITNSLCILAIVAAVTYFVSLGRCPHRALTASYERRTHIGTEYLDFTICSNGNARVSCNSADNNWKSKIQPKSRAATELSKHPTMIAGIIDRYELSTNALHLDTPYLELLITHPSTTTTYTIPTLHWAPITPEDHRRHAATNAIIRYFDALSDRTLHSHFPAERYTAIFKELLENDPDGDDDPSTGP